jgi:hypothetical protein
VALESVTALSPDGWLFAIEVLVGFSGLTADAPSLIHRSATPRMVSVGSMAEVATRHAIDGFSLLG